ncbi:MAG: phosphoadenosine phosphosulfate reductase, partial [Candidatus Aenigmatarchaeota archaeon]
MIKIIVRSKKDADALKATLNVFYQGWNIEIATLKGVRTLDKIKDALNEVYDEDKLNIVLLGKENEDVFKKIGRAPKDNIVVHLVPRKKVRNARIWMIHKEIEKALAYFRLSIVWNEEERSYILMNDNYTSLTNYDYNPAYDNFLAIGKVFRENLSRLIKTTLHGTPLLLRKMGGEHNLYVAERLVAKIIFKDYGIPVYEILDKETSEGASIDKTLKLNTKFIKKIEKISLSYMQRIEPDTVLVPWSGGKDSTVALILAIKSYGKKKVKAVYVDTGIEFEQTRDYVETIAKKIGVSLFKVYARLDEEIKKIGLLPKSNNRWCTEIKIKTLLMKLRELQEGKTVVVIGDRQAESEARARRPLIRYEENRMILTPIKLWSGVHVQLYHLYNGIPLNPLYEIGFYRIGC